MRIIFYKQCSGVPQAVRRLLLPVCLSLPFAARTQSFADSLTLIAGTTGGRVGVAIRTDGATPPSGMQDLRAHEHFPMMSVFKFPMALYILDQAEKGKLDLEERLPIRKSDWHMHSPLLAAAAEETIRPTIGELTAAIIVLSDNVACDRLLQRIGGPGVVNRYVHGLGLNGIQIVHTEGEMAADPRKVYENWCTPATMDTLLRRFHEGRLLQRAFTDTLTHWMTISQPAAHRLKGLLPPAIAATLAHKPGTSDTDETGLTAATNDVGILLLPDGHPLYMSVFVSDSHADVTTREAAIARIARLAYQTAVHRIH